MTRSEEYRLKAVNCLIVAQRIPDSATRAAIIARAQSWFALARQPDNEKGTRVVQLTGTFEEGRSPFSA
jgi:hypothetical protein